MHLSDETCKLQIGGDDLSDPKRLEGAWSVIQQKFPKHFDAPSVSDNLQRLRQPLEGAFLTIKAALDQMAQADSHAQPAPPEGMPPDVVAEQQRLLVLAQQQQQQLQQQAGQQQQLVPTDAAATTAAGNALLQQHQQQLQLQQQQQQQQPQQQPPGVPAAAGLPAAATAMVGPAVVHSQPPPQTIDAGAVSFPGGDEDMLQPRGQKSVADTSDADLLSQPLCKAPKM